jgi:uncharacterized protein YecE (DUF72 family)
MVQAHHPITADFARVRRLGDRKVIVDRQAELREWVNVVYKINGQGIPIFAYANNHFQGHAPATVELCPELWKQKTKYGLRIESVPPAGRLF